MTAEEKKYYSNEVRARRAVNPRMSWAWHEDLLEYIPYKQLQVVNGETAYALWRMNDESLTCTYIDFVKPGKTYYAVKNQGLLSVHHTFSKHRKEPVPAYHRAPLMPRFFTKAGSVFANFQEDSQETMDVMLSYDSDLWKIPRIIKDKQDYKLCEYLINERYPNLIEIYTNCRAIFGNGITIPCSGFKRLALAMKIMTYKAFNQTGDITMLAPTDVDRFLIACNYQEGYDRNANQAGFGLKENFLAEELNED